MMKSIQDIKEEEEEETRIVIYMISIQYSLLINNKIINSLLFNTLLNIIKYSIFNINLPQIILVYIVKYN